MNFASVYLDESEDSDCNILENVIYYYKEYLYTIVRKMILDRSSPLRLYVESWTSIHIQNIALYIFGIIVNWIASLITGRSHLESNGFFHGFSVWAWCIVITQALNGIIISLVLKHSSNITRLFMIGSSMVLTTLLSYALFGYRTNMYFIASFVIILYAMYLYQTINSTSYSTTVRLL